MPIFTDGGRVAPPEAADEMFIPHRSAEKRSSEDSVRTELCEGPLLDHGARDVDTEDIRIPSSDTVPVSNRMELIERLKRGESSTWVPGKNMEALYQSIDQETRHRRTETSLRDSERASEIEIEDRTLMTERLESPADIKRPKSALHSGDFRQQQDPVDSASDRSTLLSTHLATHRIETGGLCNDGLYQHPDRLEKPSLQRKDHTEQVSSGRSRAPSLLAFSSSFVLQPPTSPLAYSQNTDDADMSPTTSSFALTPSFSRRHTLPARPESDNNIKGLPSQLHHLPSSPPQRDTIVPRQAHQPRRSLTSSFGISKSPPQTPDFSRHRRPSLNFDSSPLHHASMVGSYEESILRGRMSTTPSKPLDFVAEIGVLGFGKCKSSLRCPAHVIVPFPAVFYSYSNTESMRGAADEEPSPYVGLIDLENSLDPYTEPKSSGRSRISTSHLVVDDNKLDVMTNVPKFGSEATSSARRIRDKQIRRSATCRAPLGGAYRIPQKGQLQIIIRNPNKTAVKLFLVPYDLSDMEPGSKTFIRQRSFSTGPLMDLPKALNPESSPPPKGRPSLRYLIHLHMCCPSRGRFFLYKSIRVVFANRVPDGKENLQNEVQLPEPRYSSYKPCRETSGSLSSAIDKSQRRRSSGFHRMAQSSYLDSRTSPQDYKFPLYTYDETRGHQLERQATNQLHPGSASTVSQGLYGAEVNLAQDPLTGMDIDSGPMLFSPASRDSASLSAQLQGSEAPIGEVSNVTPLEVDHAIVSNCFGKLQPGESGYGGFERSTEWAMGQSLLSQHLRSLDAGSNRPPPYNPSSDETDLAEHVPWQ